MNCPPDLIETAFIRWPSDKVITKESIGLHVNVHANLHGLNSMLGLCCAISIRRLCQVCAYNEIYIFINACLNDSSL